MPFPQSKHFKEAEFHCKCNRRFCDGTPTDVDPLLIAVLDNVRAAVGRPVVVHSGCRCKRYNAEVCQRYGLPITDSQHSYGTAADISCPGLTKANFLSVVKAEIVRLRRAHPDRRCGLGFWMSGDRLHVDVRRGTPGQALATWSY